MHGNRTTDTPRTDACPHCGDKRDSGKHYKYECGTFDKYPEGTSRTELCHQTEVSNLWRKRAEKAEAEVERLNAALDQMTSDAMSLSKERDHWFTKAISSSNN